MNDHDLDRMLAESFSDGHIDNDGFTERVLEELPRGVSWRHVRRPVVLLASAVAACAALPLAGVDVAAMGSAIAGGFSQGAALQLPSLAWLAGLGAAACGVGAYVRECVRS